MASIDLKKSRQPARLADPVKSAAPPLDSDRVRRSIASGNVVSRAQELPTAFSSILFVTPDDRANEPCEVPAFFVDLNCDQVVDAITAGREEYNLKPFFYACLRRVDAINYRQEVMQDLENEHLFKQVGAFAQKMRLMREHLLRAQKSHYKEQKQAWFLGTVEIYCDGITTLVDELAHQELKSRGLRGFRDYLATYGASARFTALASGRKKLRTELDLVKYCTLVKGNSFTVRGYEGEVDYSATIDETFAKFRQGAVEDYRVKFPSGHDMNHIEAKILEFVAKLHPELFTALDEFCARHQNYQDDTVAEFDREVQFYLAYLDHIAVLKGAGLRFCYPRISDRDKHVFDHDGFDIALADKLVSERGSVVCNDFDLRGAERILVVSGPNQGGKTTFARTFGQLHYLACIGCPVPGRAARLVLFDRLFTHFEKEEKVENLRGKLEDDLIRIRDILDRATSRSVIVINEIFTSTTIQDETFLSKKIMEKMVELDVLSVWVTFVDELASFGEQTVSMVSTVVPENPTVRTFKIVRRPADGLAYAMAIAQKYRLTYDSIKRRIES